MKHIVTIFLIIINIFCVYAFFIEPRWIEVTYNTVPLRPGLEALQGTRIVHLSDLHLRAANLGRPERSLIRRVNDLTPDIVCVTGDHITKVKSFDAAFEMIEAFTPTVRTYGVLGNADYQRAVALATTIRTRGLKPSAVLGRNVIVSATVNQTPVSIALIDDPITKNDDQGLFDDLAGYPGFKLVLVHSYIEFSRGMTSNADLILCGHTHGGQINVIPADAMLAWLRAAYESPIKYLSGFKREGNTYININRGIGMSGIPARFRARPEISVIELK
jgi:predicted MPP superfamily phosphohydrolase